MKHPMTPEDFQKATHVSRETLDRFRAYAELLVKWQRRINLVGATTLDDIWGRHFFDSAQLAPLLPPETRTVADLGSGAGFPGLVLALMGVPDVHLIDSDGRKAAFLHAVMAETGVRATVHAVRIEAVKIKNFAPVVTSRALAPLPQLIEWGQEILAPGGQMLFLKGENVEEELTEAQKKWKMTLARYPSQSDSKGTILRLEGLHLRHDP